MVLDQAGLLSDDPRVRFAALVHDLGKGTTPPSEWPSHRGHEERSVALVEALAARLRIPNEHRELAVIVARYHGIVHRAFELKPKTILEFMERADAFRRPERFDQALLACEADSRGRAGLEAEPYPQRDYLLAARRAAALIKPSAEEIAASSGAEIAQQLHRRRLRAIAARARKVRGCSAGLVAIALHLTAADYSVCRRSLTSKPHSGASIPRDHAMALKRSPISPGSISRLASAARRAN